jgi:glycerophosphoryl diester phosphodiesterase
MNTLYLPKRLSRRGFIQTAAVAGGTLLRPPPRWRAA